MQIGKIWEALELKNKAQAVYMSFSVWTSSTVHGGGIITTIKPQEYTAEQ